MKNLALPLLYIIQLLIEILNQSNFKISIFILIAQAIFMINFWRYINGRQFYIGWYIAKSSDEQSFRNIAGALVFIMVACTFLSSIFRS